MKNFIEEISTLVEKSSVNIKKKYTELALQLELEERNYKIVLIENEIMFFIEEAPYNVNKLAFSVELNRGEFILTATCFEEYNPYHLEVYHFESKHNSAESVMENIVKIEKNIDSMVEERKRELYNQLLDTAILK